MVAYRVMVVLHMNDNNPENYATNTWHVLSPDVTGAEDFSTSVVNVYKAFRSYLSPLISLGGHEIKIYNLEEPEPRAPVSEYTWAFSSAPSGTALPPEVCKVVSFQAERMSGVPQARRRNRVYIGPLNTTCVGTNGRPAAGVATNLATNVGQILTDSVLADWTWAIHSSYTPEWGTWVDNGWIDDEFDTQRRRGRKATSRTLFS